MSFEGKAQAKIDVKSGITFGATMTVVNIFDIVTITLVPPDSTERFKLESD